MDDLGGGEAVCMRRVPAWVRDGARTRMAAVGSDGLTPPQRARERYLRRAEIPARIRRFSVDDLDDRGSPSVREAVRDFVRDCASGGERAPGVGLLLYGRVGRGKTTAAVVALREVLTTAPRAWLGRTPGQFDALRPGYYASYAELLDIYRTSWDDDESGHAAKDLLRSIMCSHPASARYRNVRVLVLDDVGKEHAGATRFNINTLHDVLRRRYDRGAPTIITTNLGLDDWREVYGAATASFIHEAFVAVLVSGRDRRLS